MIDGNQQDKFILCPNLLNPQFLKEELDSEYAFIYRESDIIV
jgi:hypothetical protein